MTYNRKNCPMRHENGNCTVIGGFCTSVNDGICEGLKNAYEAGKRNTIDTIRNALIIAEASTEESKCDKCENYGVVGACQGRYDTGMNWVCNFYSKNGSATITIHNTLTEASTEVETRT